MSKNAKATRRPFTVRDWTNTGGPDYALRAELQRTPGRYAAKARRPPTAT